MPRQDVNGIGQEVADRAGVYRNYFYRLRASNLECFEYMKSLCPTDMAKGYRMYQDLRVDVTNRACDIYYELEDDRLLNDFGRFLVEHGVYANPFSYERTKTTIFKPEGVKTFTSLKLLMRSNELYEKYERKDK